MINDTEDLSSSAKTFKKASHLHIHPSHSPEPVVEGVPVGPQQKGGILIFTINPSITNTVADGMAILVMGFIHFL